MSDVDVEVVVVGAGIAGLVAARELVRAGRSVVLLEARDRVGGRTDHHLLANGHPIETGGQWIGPTQTHLVRLLAELGLATYDQHRRGERLTFFRGKGVGHDRADGSLLSVAGAQIGQIKQRLEAMAATVSLSAPWQTEGAAVWDAMTFESWLVGEVEEPAVRDYWRGLTAALFCAEAGEISLLHVLFYLKSGGMLDILAGIEGGAQDWRIIGGSHLICERMAAELGDRVRLGATVHRIGQDAGGAVVRFAAGTVTAERVVVAIPPTLAGRISYRPLLPARRDGLTQRVPMGSVIKVNVVYDQPFWRDAGLSGEVFSLNDPLSAVLDNTPHQCSNGVLVGFIEGANARTASELSPARRQAMVVECLVRFFGEAAREVREYVEKDWTAEEYSRGCYGGHLGAGVWTQYGPALAAPIGRIHWAGSETAEVWNGYMDGAVRSGERAAAEILFGLPAFASSR
jgi:monoamine oxidase